MIEYPETEDLTARLVVVGVGGGGGNAVNTMIASGVEGVEFVAANTDAQALKRCKASTRIQLGAGLGAGSNPDVGREHAEASVEEIKNVLDGAHMVFVTAGMGGGTGTGAGPVVAKLARELGILTVGVVTKPFDFEGRRRMRIAESGLAELKDAVDSLILIPNQRLVSLAGKNGMFMEAFKKADEVLLNAVKGVSDLIVRPGLINVDFADVKAVMSEKGRALMGVGSASGEDRALTAARAAINSPLLEDVSIEGARGVLVNVQGPTDMSMGEIQEACTMIQEEADEDALIIFGANIDENLGSEIRFTVVATGFEKRYDQRQVSKIARLQRENLDLPSFKREAKAERSSSEISSPNGKLKPISPFVDDEDGRRDVPAFIRKRMGANYQ